MRATRTPATLLILLLTPVHGWVPSIDVGKHSASSMMMTTTTTTALFGKGLNRARNKQADLKKKMELAKKLNRDKDESVEESTGEKSRLSDKEMKEMNDRRRFEELLKKESANVLNDFSSDGYLTKQQEEEEITAALSGVERLFEGDPAPTDCFEELVSIKSENAIGKRTVERLVPWLRKNPERQSEYLIVLSDPRMQSPELRESIKKLRVELPQDIYSRLIVVNVDSPAENRRWLKKENLVDQVDLYSDEKMEWMRAYSALGEKRWSMTMFILAEGRVQKLAREVDIYGVSRTIQNAVKSLDEARL